MQIASYTDAAIILVGTKLDLKEAGKGVTTEDGERMKETIGAKAYIECSAKTQENLKQVFDEAIQIVLKGRSSSQRKKEAKKCLIL